MIVRDTEKAKKALHYFVTKIEERDALIVEFENKVGTLAPVTKILGSHGVFIDYVYGTSGDGFQNRRRLFDKRQPESRGSDSMPIRALGVDTAVEACLRKSSIFKDSLLFS